MEQKCPGRMANASLDTVVVPCPSCGHEIEMFGDEQKVHCKCGQWVFREALPSCVMWCAAAQQCLGDIEGLSDLLQQAHDAPDQEAQKLRLAELKTQIAEMRKNCSRPESEGEQKT